MAGKSRLGTLLFFLYKTCYKYVLSIVTERGSSYGSNLRHLQSNISFKRFHKYNHFCLELNDYFKVICILSFCLIETIAFHRASEARASLLFAHKSDIRKISLNKNHDMVAIVNDTRSSCAIDYNFRTGMIFWSDVMTQKIYK